MAALADVDFLSLCHKGSLRAWVGRRTVNSPAKEWFLVFSEQSQLRIDDDVAEALYSGNRRVPTYTNRRLHR